MAKVINMSQKKREKEEKSVSVKKQPDAITIKLWRLSMDFDDIIKKGVIDDSLPPDEIAAIVAHRLGTLISCCEKPKELSKFCCNIVERLNVNCVSGDSA